MSDVGGHWIVQSMNDGFQRIRGHSADLLGVTRSFISQRLPSWSASPPQLTANRTLTLPGDVRLDRDILLRLLRALVSLVGCALFSYWLAKLLEEKLDPSVKARRAALLKARLLMDKVGIAADIELSQHELVVAANLVDATSLATRWEDIGGLDQVVQELQEGVILPFLRHDLFGRSLLFRAPSGALLYGPPGCGKTMLAKACACSSHARFLDLQVASLTDKWYGESQKLAEAVFSLARKIQPVIIFIDEVDAFLRSRDSNEHETTAMMKAQFMSLWDGLATEPDNRILILGATNRPRDVDAAILRRMPAQFYVGPPAEVQRLAILRRLLRAESVVAGALQRLPELAAATDGFSGSDLRELCRVAAVTRARSLLRKVGLLSAVDSNGDIAERQVEGAPAPKDSDWRRVDSVTPAMAQLTWPDFEAALSKMRESRLLNASFDCCTNSSSIPID